jgi:hypothetical protein
MEEAVGDQSAEGQWVCGSVEKGLGCGGEGGGYPVEARCVGKCFSKN